jgi:hypothetical protein
MNTYDLSAIVRGEVIIRIAVAFVFLLAALSFSAASLCAGLMLLDQFHRRCLAVNHDCSLSACTKEERRSVIRFL